MSISSFFGAVVADIVKAAHAFKAEIEKMAAAAPGVQKVVDQYAGDAGLILGAVGLPQAEAVEAVAIKAIDAVFAAVEAAGEAAAANGLSVSLDSATVAAVKAILPQIKALAAVKK